MIAMGIDVTQWRIQIARYWKFAGRTRHRRGKSPGVKAASAKSYSPLLALLLSFCLITAPSLLLQAGDVERNPGPTKTQSERDSLRYRLLDSIGVPYSQYLIRPHGGTV